MPRFSKASRVILDTLHPDLAAVMIEAIGYVDFKLIEGHRGREAQNLYFKQGVSKLLWPNSKHNPNPSKAVDIAPYPVDWEDTESFIYIAGWIMCIAAIRGVPMRYGGDWNKNNLMRDEKGKLRDYGHFELDY